MARITYSSIEFGYMDGRWDTVLIAVGPKKKGAVGLSNFDASVTIMGNDLDMVTAAFFSLRDYDLKPGIKSFGLRRRTVREITTVEDDRRHYRKGIVGPLSYSLSIADDRPRELRLWIQSTQNPDVWFNLFMDKKTTDEFGQRLADAAGWDIEV